MIIRLLISILFVCTFAVYATEKTSSTIVYSSTNNMKVASTFAELWGLTETDVDKYKLIMQGPRGVFSPDIAPPLALALEESNYAEKTRYLTIYVKLEYDRTRKDLETSRMYDRIFKELYDKPVIDNSIFFKNKNEYIKPSDRFVIFIDSRCKDCKGKLLMGLMKSANFPKNPTDIYVMNLASKQDLHKWATENGVSVEDVQNGAVTLNLIQKELTPPMLDKSFSNYVLRNDSLLNFTN